MTTAEAFSLPRTGDVPLTFSGVVVARASSQQPRTKRDTPLERRWHELTLFRTTSGKLVAHITYRTDWTGELGDSVARVGSLPDLIDWLRDYDPCDVVVGFPPGKGFADRQRRLLESIELGYDTALSTLLAELGAGEPVDHEQDA